MSEPNLKEILTAAKAAVTAAFAGVIRPESIYITPETSYIPAAVAPPCIGIKDGAVRYSYRSGRGTVRESGYVIQYAVFSGLLRDEDAIMGYLDSKGLLDMTADLDAALDDNRLGINWIAEAMPTGESGTSLIGGETGFMQQKIIEYSYKCLGKRPGAARL